MSVKDVKWEVVYSFLPASCPMGGHRYHGMTPEVSGMHHLLQQFSYTAFLSKKGCLYPKIASISCLPV